MKVTPFVLSVALLGGSLLPIFSRETNHFDFNLVRQLNEAFVHVAESVSPAVVVLSVTEKSTVFPEPSPDDAQNYENWREFHRQFKDVPPGSGSGIIIRTNGYILTNRHVVENAEKIHVRLLDGRTFMATVCGVDPQSDVAVIRVDADNVPVARLGDSSKVRVGEFAIAIGAPFSLDYTVTFGHISAKNRANIVPLELGGNAMDQDFLQTDANINPGNSGGPLVNIDGEVIGVNTLIRGPRSGIGFAIPINLAKEIAEQLIATGKFVRPWLGVEIIALDEEPDLKQSDLQSGVVIRSILPHSPAAESRLQPGDIITAVDGKPVATPQALRREVRGKAIGQTMNLTVRRSGDEISVAITASEYTAPPPAQFAEYNFSGEAQVSHFGLSVRTLNSRASDQIPSLRTEGVVVIQVATNSPGSRSNIQPGDIITRVNLKPITDVEEFTRAARAADLNKGVLLNLLRGGGARYEILRESEH